METTQIIRASAEVVTISSFRPGDVYKRVENDYTGNAGLRFGIVQDVMNNGTDAAFTALEYRSDYSSGYTAELKVYDGSKPAALFAATPEEINVHIGELVASCERRREEAHEKYLAATKALAAVHRVAANIGDLTAPQLAPPAVLDVDEAEEPTGPFAGDEAVALDQLDAD